MDRLTEECAFRNIERLASGPTSFISFAVHDENKYHTSIRIETMTLFFKQPIRRTILNYNEYYLTEESKFMIRHSPYYEDIINSHS